MDKYGDIKDRIVEAAKKEGAELVAVIGSEARKTDCADKFSDLDVIVVTDKVDNWIYGDIPRNFGYMKISFTEPTIGGGIERRMFFEEYRDVDLIVLTPMQFNSALEEGVLSSLMNRGYLVLYDSADYKKRLEMGLDCKIYAPQMTRAEFQNVVSDFFFHCIWAMKKLLRGEIWAAKMSVDSYLKSIVLRVIALYSYVKNGCDTWHDGRFFDRWADEEIISAISTSFAYYNRKDIYRALCETKDIFTRISKEAARILGYDYPKSAEEYAEKFLRENSLE